MQRVLSFPPQSNRRFGDPSEFVSKRMCFSFMFSIAFLAVLAGFLLGRFVFDQELELSKAKLRKANQQQIATSYRPQHQNATAFLAEVCGDCLGQHLLSLREGSTDARNLHHANLVKAFLEDAAFDLVSPVLDCQANLSFPDPERKNQVVIHQAEDVRLKINDCRSVVSEPDGHRTSAMVTGNIFYVNFGRDEDYHHLDTLGVSVKDGIVLARVGRTSTVELVTNALEHEALGVILYRDPQQKNTGADILPAADLAELKATADGAVPVICITAEDAEGLFREMSGDASSESWRGDLNSTYPIGPGFTNPDRRLTLHVNTITSVKKFYDVLGAIRGTQEPDRFVMIAHDRTPTTEESTAIVMEITRVLGVLKKKGWRPHRSIIVASWGAKDPCHSRTKDWWSHLTTKAVAYLKIESGLLGNDSVSSRGTLLLEKAFREASGELSLGRAELDVMLEGGSDTNLVENGVPFLELKQQGVTRMKDVTSLWGVIMWKLSQSSGLPFSLDSYARFFNHSVHVIENFKLLTQRPGLFLESFIEATQKLILAISSFQSKWSNPDPTKSIPRLMNDQLLNFVQSLRCREKSDYKDIIFTRSTRESESFAGFGILQDLLRETTSANAPDDLQQQIIYHLADLLECINAARFALTDGLEMFIPTE